MGDLLTAIPFTNLSAISLPTAKILKAACLRLKPKVIVELGTGTGTSAAILAQFSRAKVWSVDNDRRYFAKAKSLLAHHRIPADRVHFVFAPLLNSSYAGRRQRWYNPNALKVIKGPIDLLMIDGPVGTVGRYPAVPVFMTRLAPRALILLDDANRAKEKSIYHDWIKYLAAHKRRSLGHLEGTDRGLGMIQLL